MKSCCRIFGGVSACVALFIGISLVSLDKQVFKWIYKRELVLSPTSVSLPMWKDLPAPLLAKMYLFNVTNAQDVVEKGAIPVVKEVGPYTFYENHHKTDIVWNNNNDTVTYQQNRTWVFVPELSEASLDANVTIVNPIAATVGDTLRRKGISSMFFLINMFLKAQKEKVFVTHTANEIMFKGFDDPLLKAMKSLKNLMKGVVPDGAFTDKFGFFYNRNGSLQADGVMNMFTGAGDVNNMGKVYAWNYSTHHFFPGECGQVKGGAGEFYPPGLNKTFIEMYSSDLCRSVKFEFNDTVDSQGIPAYQFISKKSMFENGTDNPENACFNPPSVSLPSGVFNASSCRFGAPVFVSQPHFHLADPYYRSLVHGLRPSAEKHQTHLAIEPESGIPVDVAARFQINVLIDKVPGISMFEKVPKSFIPVMWFEDSMSTPSNMVTKMKMMAYLKNIVSGVGWAIFSLGLTILIVLGVIYGINRRSVRDDRRPILSDSDNENVFKE